MRILFVSQEMPPETAWGGIGAYVDVLSEALAAKGADVHVLSVVEHQTASTRDVNGVTVHRRPLPFVPGAGRLPPQAWRRAWLSVTVSRLIRKLHLRPSVVECPEWMAEGLALGLKGEFPLVVRLHSSARQLFPHTGQGKAYGGLDGRLAAWFEEVSARHANVVASSRANLDEVAQRMRLGPSALHAIPCPVRLPPTSPMPDQGAPRVTFVGRLEPRKAPEIVLRAAPRVVAEVPAARFVFVGRDGVEAGTASSATWLRREATRLRVAHAVELVGQLDRSGVAAELRRSTVCAFPSRWESFGNVVAEASATGRPVVVSPIPPFQELVDDGITGSFARLDDPEAWASSLIGLLTDHRRASMMGQAGAAKVSGISAPERVADLALAAYEHAIERWRRGERAGTN
jgi:glycosyltransferase involved in cell wall biosynthesis